MTVAPKDLLATCEHTQSRVLTDEDFNRYWYCLSCGRVFQAMGPSSYIPDIREREAAIRARSRGPEWPWSRRRA